MESNKKVALLILDGWGYGNKDASDAVFNAKTPVFDQLLESYPNSTLLTDGEHVGLPEGQMGNSEVGHLNIGSGRVVYQDLVRINNSIKNGELAENETLNKAFTYAKTEDKKVHFIGLVSDGGIHSHQKHLVELCKIAHQHGITKSYVHAITDGRDRDPKSGQKHLQNLLQDLQHTPTQIATLVGRYYAMDRDLRWERIRKAYQLMVNGEGKKFNNCLGAIQQSYENGITDEFIEPIVFTTSENEPIAKIEENDVVICFNFRTDRCRELTKALHQMDFPEFGMQKLPLHYLTMTTYDESFENVNVIFKKDNLENTLGEVIASNGLTQVRIAETEKYPHVTFFFSGGREHPFAGEKRIMAQSPKVATYDLQPEMSADEITHKICEEIESNQPNFICLNFANPDMVGHTGVYSAIVKAVEKVDECLDQIITTGLKNDYSFVIIADHGNADFAINHDGSPNTAHTTNPVPLIIIDKKYKNVQPGKLADIAPTILKMLELTIPVEMDGNILI